jgi:CubicO group peptidase (beta-lactamase class C family)
MDTVFASSESAAERCRQVEQSIRRPAELRPQGWQVMRMAEDMARENIPGASVAVIDQGEIAWAKAYGVIEAGKPEPVTLETRFQAASISKPVAALTLLTLVQEGRVVLDEDICAYLTSWQLPEPEGWRPRVTCRQLLSHSAGVTVHGFPGYRADRPVPTLQQVLDGAPPANTPPIQVDTIPGLYFRYSGGGFTILQQLIEDVTGQLFWQAAQERVLGPAGMDHSTYLAPLREDWQPFAAVGHRGDGAPLLGRWHIYPESAAAGLWTTPLDLARLVVLLEQTLQGQTERLLHRELLVEMLSPQTRVRGISLNGSEGLSWFLSGKNGDDYYGHGGSNEGYRAQVIVRKGRGQAGIIMTNADSGDALTDDWMNTIAVEYGWKAFAYLPSEPIELPADALAAFAGQYRLEDGVTVCVRETAAGLVFEYPGQAPLAMRPHSADSFFVTQLNTRVRFICAAGRCTGLVICQDGIETTAARVVCPTQDEPIL